MFFENHKFVISGVSGSWLKFVSKTHVLIEFNDPFSSIIDRKQRHQQLPWTRTGHGHQNSKLANENCRSFMKTQTKTIKF